MAINGCLTLAWLEEDDPIRGYFRVRPAAVISAEPQAYAHDGEYGDEGFLRVVPDKNEMGTFKTRMRTLGRLCLIDLRQHPRDNDKIRPNRNYSLGSDRNPYMIYSDVIRELPRGLACEVVKEGGTPAILDMAFVAGEGTLDGPYAYDGATLSPCGELLSAAQDELAARILELYDAQGASVQLLLNQAGDLSSLLPASSGEAAGERAHSPRGGRKAARASEAAQGGSAAQIEAAEPAEHADAPRPLPYALRALKEQVGLNPRRGRSLREVVDEQWRARHQEDLGQVVPPSCGTRPVEGPVERALSALDEAWQFKGAHAPLIRGLIAQDELVHRLFEVWTPKKEAPPTDERLIELEADRLRLITEIDGLSRRSRDMKAEVLRELERSGEVDAQALRNSLVLLQQQLDERQAQLDAMARQRRALEADIARELGQPLTERVARHIIDQRMDEVLSAQTPVPTCAPAPEEPPRELLEPEALVDRLSGRLRAHGWQFGRDAVVHMLTVLALNRPLIAVDFAGQDDACLGEALSEALGDSALRLRARINGQCEALPCRERALYSVVSYPDGEPVSATALDAGFVLRLRAELCAPEPLKELLPLDEGSYALMAQGQLSEEAREQLSAIAARLSEFGARVPHGAFVDCARYMAAACAHLSGGEAMALDWALASRVLPGVLVSATDELLRALPDVLAGMRECLATMRMPLPVYR